MLRHDGGGCTEAGPWPTSTGRGPQRRRRPPGSTEVLGDFWVALACEASTACANPVEVRAFQSA